MTDALGRPFQQTHRITLGVHKGFQICDQGRVPCAQAFSSTSPAADAITLDIHWSAFDLHDARAYRPARRLRVPCHLTDAATSDPLRFDGHIDPPLPFIQHRTHHIVGCLCLVLFHSDSLPTPTL